MGIFKHVVCVFLVIVMFSSSGITVNVTHAAINSGTTDVSRSLTPQYETDTSLKVTSTVTTEHQRQTETSTDTSLKVTSTVTTEHQRQTETSTVNSKPLCPNKELSPLSLVNVNSSTITLKVSSDVDTSHLCVRKQSKSQIQDDSECKPLIGSTVKVYDLDSGTLYNISIYSYINISGEQQLGDRICSSVQYHTRPNNPSCGGSNEKYLIDVTDSTIKVDLSSFPENRNLCVQVQPSPEKKIKCKPLQNNIAIIHSLNSSTLYNFTVYSYINGTNGQLLSEDSCYVGAHLTRPKAPVCPINYDTDVTSSTFKVDLSSFPKNGHFCVKVQPRPGKEPVCKSPENNIAVIHSLNASTLYNFSVFSYINDAEEQKLLSVKSCSIGNHYTKPMGPNCEANGNNYVTDVTNTTIKVDLSLFSGNGRLCVQVLPRTEKDPECYSLHNSIAVIGNLTPSTLYNFNVYSYIDDTEGQQLLSLESCPVGKNYTRPTGLNCTRSEKKYVKEVTSTTVKVDLSSFPRTGNICVQVQPRTETQPMCKPLQDGIAILRSLTPSTLYNFTAYSYINDTHGKQFLSVESCPVGENYTLPHINCAKLSPDSSTTSIRIRMEDVRNIKVLNFTITSEDNNTIITSYLFPISKDDNYFLNMSSGRTYIVLVTAQGVDGTWTTKPCPVKITTPLPAPFCPTDALVAKSGHISIDFNSCSFDNGTKTAQIMYNSTPTNFVTNLQQIVFLSNLMPGKKVEISIYAYGQNGVKSSPYQMLAYTRPSDPICSKLSYSATNESLVVETRNLLTNGSIRYNITLNGKSLIKSTADKYIFDLLLPGTKYKVTVIAIGEGNQTSLNGCNTQLFTKPTDPVCSAITIENTTTKSFEINLEYITNGTLYYFAEYNIDNTMKNASFRSDSGFKENITGLKSGTEYTFVVFAVSENDVKSSESCVVTHFTYPSPPTEITNITIGTTNFHIQWRRSEGNVDAYNVTVSCNCSCNPKVTHSGSDTEAYVSDLKPGTHCGVTIVAISGGLYSIPFHFPHIKTIEKVPGKVSNVSISDVQSDGFTLSWEQPNSPNGDLSSYNINIKPGSNFTTDSLTTSFPFSNLTPGTCYNVTIAAVNSAGEGAIETKTVYTTEQAPSMVQDLKIKNTSSTSINVKWNKPLFPNGVVRWYIILVQKVKEEGCEQLIEFKCENCQNPCPDAETNAENENLKKEYYPNDRNASSCPIHLTSNFKSNDELLRYNITGLEIFTEYFVSVAAYTNKGGGENATSNITTSADKPSQPGKPVLMNLNISNVSFKYSKPEHQNGIIRNQEIEYSHVPYDECLSEQKGETVPNTTVQSIQENGKMYLASLENLKSFWEYSIRVRVKTYAGYSNYSELLIIRTFPSTPEKVSNITSKSLTSRGVILSWIQPCHPNGIIRNYRIEIKNEFNISVSVNNTNSNQTSFNVTGLLPFRNYTISIFTEVVNVTKRSPPATSERFQTLTEAPLQPGEIKINETTASSVRVSWDHPPLKTGPTRYEVSAIDKTNDVLIFTCKTRGFENTSCVIEGLDAFWNYSLIVKVYTGDFDPNNTTSKVETGQSAPGPVASFSVNQDPNVTTKTNVHVKWKQPTKRNLNGIIRNYFIQYWYSQSNKKIEKKCGKCYDAVIDVEPEKNYIFEIFAMTIENATEKNYLRQNLTTEPGAPLPLPPSKIPLIQLNPSVSDDQNQISVAFSRLALCKEKNGKIRQWFVIVSKESKGSPSIFYGSKQKYMDYITNNYKTWRDVYEKEESHTYIASDSWKPRCDESNRMRRSVEKPVAFKLGSDEKCSTPKYCNGPLEAGKTYRVKFGKCTNKGCLESEYSSPFTTAPNNVPVIAGSVAAVVLALIVIILVIVFLKRRRKGPIKDPSNGDSGQENVGFSAVEMTTTTKPPKAVRIADFANYVQKMHADSNLLFSQEYKLLKETCATHTTKAAEIQVNRIKNRYTNILAYDHSRVKLLPTEDDEGSDYINANYIPGFSSQREYIATQGPLPFTRDEFWRMIWEQNVSIVVMLTQLVERGRRKCDIYWPETTREPVYYGDLVVETESESTLPDYVLRVMSIKLGDSRKTVKQFCYLAWPDMGIPETSETMLKFTKEVRSHLPPPKTNRGPLVVHCSAGVGRTGTFIAVDYLMQHVTSSDVVDIYNYVMKMRNNRPNMVQTEDQYIFIHDCIRDFVNRSDEDSDDGNEEGGGDDSGNPIYANM